MTHDLDTTLRTERPRTRLASRFAGALFLGSAIVLLLAALGWWTLRTASREIGTVHSAAADNLIARINMAGFELAAGIVLGIALLVALYVHLTRGIATPLVASAHSLQRLVSGDSDENMPAGQLARDDELGDLARAVQGLIDRRRGEMGVAERMYGFAMETLRRADGYAGQVMEGCGDIASSGGRLSANSSGITTVVTGISDNIGRVVRHADDNAGMAGQAGKLAESGNHSVERGYEDVGELGAVMLNMQACGDKIVGIAKSIGDIAFQTNLLALNANVEAARAGRHGKGFTIVAEEVRNLAVRSSKAAEETSTLMKETVEQVELAATVAGRINATFAELQTGIEEAGLLMEKIAAASGEQSGDIDRIASTLRQVDRSVRENMEYARDVLERANGLANQAGELRQALRNSRQDA